MMKNGTELIVTTRDLVQIRPHSRAAPRRARSGATIWLIAAVVKVTAVAAAADAVEQRIRESDQRLAGAPRASGS